MFLTILCGNQPLLWKDVGLLQAHISSLSSHADILEIPQHLKQC